VQIDWLTVVAQIVNFLVLVWLLQRFLYRPITSAMARREERIETRLSEAKAAREEVEAEAARLREQQQALDASREEMLSEARQEAAASAPGSRTTSARRWRPSARPGRRTWRRSGRHFTTRLRQRAGHQVIDIVGRVLRDYAGSDLAGQVAGTFADRLAASTPTRGQARARGGSRGGPARVESSIALKPGARSQITRAIHDCVARDIEVEYHEDGDLLLGVRLTIGEQTVEWSAARFLHRLETTLDEVIEGSGRHRPAARRPRAEGHAMTLDDLHDDVFAPLEDALAQVAPAIETAEIAHVVSVGNGVAEVAGFTDLRADELLTFPDGVMGIASNLSEDRAGVIVLGETERLRPGDPVRRTGRVVDVPVGAG
jgi:F-type H+-transporting ATPase subunit b